MPRHVPDALDQLGELAPVIEANAGYSLRWIGLHHPAFTPVLQYTYAWADWAELGIDVRVETRRLVRGLWSARPALRLVLRSLVACYPCDEFEGPFSKLAEACDGPDYLGWFRRYPRLRESLRPAIVARARRFNQLDQALGAGLTWARYFEGGDEAYRAIALALNRHDRVWPKTRPSAHEEDFRRHDLNQHGTITLEEGEAINRQLAELDGEPLDLKLIGCPGGWKIEPPEWWREPAQLGPAFAAAVEAGHAFAGPRWSAEDVAGYARALRALPPAVRAAVPPAAAGSALAEIEHRAAAGS